MRTDDHHLASKGDKKCPSFGFLFVGMVLASIAEISQSTYAGIEKVLCS